MKRVERLSPVILTKTQTSLSLETNFSISRENLPQTVFSLAKKFEANDSKR
jgi:hypothetical protein